MLQTINRPTTAHLGGSAAKNNSSNSIISSTRRPLGALKPRFVRVRAADNEARPMLPHSSVATSLLCIARHSSVLSISDWLMMQASFLIGRHPSLTDMYISGASVQIVGSATAQTSQDGTVGASITRIWRPVK